jgi:hypothetical protein
MGILTMNKANSVIPKHEVESGQDKLFNPFVYNPDNKVIEKDEKEDESLEEDDDILPKDEENYE